MDFRELFKEQARLERAFELVKQLNYNNMNNMDNNAFVNFAAYSHAYKNVSFQELELPFPKAETAPRIGQRLYVHSMQAFTYNGVPMLKFVTDSNQAVTMKVSTFVNSNLKENIYALGSLANFAQEFHHKILAIRDISSTWKEISNNRQLEIIYYDFEVV